MLFYSSRSAQSTFEDTFQGENNLCDNMFYSPIHNSNSLMTFSFDNYNSQPESFEDATEAYRFPQRKTTRHTKRSKDNIIHKVKTSFLNYLIKYINGLIRIYFSNQKFKIWKIDGKEQLNSNATKSFNHDLFNSTLARVLSKDLSDKIKTKDKNQNKKNIEHLKEKYSFFRALFQMTYYDFYHHQFLFSDEYIITNLLEHVDNNLKKASTIKSKIRELKMDNLDTFLENQKKKRKTNESKEYFESYLDELKKMAINIPSYFELSNLKPKNENEQKIDCENKDIEQNQLTSSIHSHIPDEIVTNEKEDSINEEMECLQLNESQEDNEIMFKPTFIDDMKLSIQIGDEATSPETDKKIVFDDLNESNSSEDSIVSNSVFFDLE